MKKLSFCLIALLIVIAIPISALSANYIGNRNSYKFHFAACHHVQKMNPKNKVPFSSRHEAINAGFVPCKTCRP